MCRYRQIQDTYAHCNHVYRVPDQMVYCPERDCKFSPYHPEDCGPNCKRTCWQYRRFPEQIDRRFDRLCPRCEERLQQQQLQQQQGQGQGQEEA